MDSKIPRSITKAVNRDLNRMLAALHVACMVVERHDTWEYALVQDAAFAHKTLEIKAEVVRVCKLVFPEASIVANSSETAGEVS